METRAAKKRRRKEDRVAGRMAGDVILESMSLRTLKPGDATHYPVDGDTVRVHYVGKLKNGLVFDSSRERKMPLEFQLGKGSVIRGWEEGIKHMSKNQIAQLIVLPGWGYGTNGYPPIIPPRATLTFEIELLDIAPPAIVEDPL